MIMCSCNNMPCEGECRSVHLNKARKPVPTKGYPGGKIPRCVAASGTEYTVERTQSGVFGTKLNILKL